MKRKKNEPPTEDSKDVQLPNDLRMPHNDLDFGKRSVSRQRSSDQATRRPSLEELDKDPEAAGRGID